VDTPDNLTERAQRHRLIHVAIQGPAEAVLSHLQHLDGVLSVESQETNQHGVCEYTLATTKARDVRADLARAVVEQGWQLLELRALRLSLEEVFVQLVTEEDAADA
jgi:ABC-2 type transport system ATP-binding protein